MAVESEGSVLEYASKDLKADRDVVFTAVKSNGWALGDASKELKNDVELKEISKKTFRPV